ncbi:MAG: thrombospondin type 3 repeat-containing protein, partial [Acidobacteria bacterium]|nr:thrombospondin type 3 repeat-containing protein [Acidobacteriota bacterium]
MRPRIGSLGRLRVQFGIDYLLGLGADFADEFNDERSRVQMTLGFGFIIPLERITTPRSQEPDIVFALPVIAPISTIPVAQSPASTESTESTESTKTAETTGAPGDADGDGVSDRDDDCPETPIGAVVSRHGCPFDEDGDGVYDGLDRCPGTPAAERTLVDAWGCPVPPVVDTIETVATETEDTTASGEIDSTMEPSHAATIASGEIDSTTASSQTVTTSEEEPAAAAGSTPKVDPDPDAS